MKHYVKVWRLREKNSLKRNTPNRGSSKTSKICIELNITLDFKRLNRIFGLPNDSEEVVSMFLLPANPLIVTITSFVAAVILTYLGARRRQTLQDCRRAEIRPLAQKPTAMYGGVAIFLTTV
jgi:hypothetical protein